MTLKRLVGTPLSIIFLTKLAEHSFRAKFGVLYTDKEVLVAIHNGLKSIFIYPNFPLLFMYRFDEAILLMMLSILLLSIIAHTASLYITSFRSPRGTLNFLTMGAGAITAILTLITYLKGVGI